MLSPELEKLKDSLEGKPNEIDNEKLLEELKRLDEIHFDTLFKSLSMPSWSCPACGRPFY